MYHFAWANIILYMYIYVCKYVPLCVGKSKASARLVTFTCGMKFCILTIIKNAIIFNFPDTYE